MSAPAPNVQECSNPTHTTLNRDASSPPLQRCGRCKAAYYCSRVCQAAHWKHHKQQCTAITTASSSNLQERAFLESEFERFFVHESIIHYTEDMTAPQLINVLQGRAAYIRSDRTPQHIAGLYTGGFSSCNVLILTARTEAATEGGCVRVEMLHIDETFPMPSLSKEVEMFRQFGGQLRVQLFYKTGVGQLVRDRVRAVLAARGVLSEERAVTEDAVSIRRDGSHLCLSKSLVDHAPIRLLRHPRERCIKLVSKVHEVIGFPQGSWSLHLFREDNWLPCKEDTCLTDYTQRMLRSNGLHGRTHFFLVENTLRSMHKEGDLPHLQQDGQDLENFLRIGALYVAEFLRRSDRVDPFRALQQDVHNFLQEIRLSPAVKWSRQVQGFFDDCLAIPAKLLRIKLAVKIITGTDMSVLVDIYDVVFHLLQMIRLHDYCLVDPHTFTSSSSSSSSSSSLATNMASNLEFTIKHDQQA